MKLLTTSPPSWCTCDLHGVEPADQTMPETPPLRSATQLSTKVFRPWRPVVAPRPAKESCQVLSK